MSLKFILFGNMCSGKTTVGQILKHDFDYSVVSAKEVIRENLESTDISVKRLAQEGHLLPDKIVTEWIFRKIDAKMQNKNPIVLDGFPRTTKQAEALLHNQTRINSIIYLDFDLGTIKKRFRNRIICNVCGTPYSRLFVDFRQECVYCGSHDLTARTTDRKDYFDVKTSEFRSVSLSVLPVFKEAGLGSVGTLNHSTFEGLRNEIRSLLGTIDKGD